jgi:hypothetical protein
MSDSRTNRLKRNTLPTEDAERSNQGCLDMKHVYTDMIPREIIARDTEKIVRRTWERYARRGNGAEENVRSACD